MAHTTAITEINKVVNNYLFKYKIPQDDYFIYLQHACDCFRAINLRHGHNVITEKVDVSSLGIIEMPQDMIGFCNLFMPIDGEFWSFTKRPRIVNTTTTVDDVEGQDSTMGEGVEIADNMYTGYGGRGAVNDYYFTIDWGARRIFCDGIKSEKAVLQYTSSGISITGATYIPQEAIPVIDAYLNWKKEEMTPSKQNRLDYFYTIYLRSIEDMRIFRFMPSRDEIEDAWDDAVTLGVIR